MSHLDPNLRSGRRRLQGSLALLGGQPDGERGALPRGTLDRDPPAVPLDDAVDDRQAQARAFAHVLGGEELIDDARPDLSRDAGSFVFFGLDAFGAVWLVDYTDRAAAVAVLDGLGGVRQQVHHHLIRRA